MSDPKIGQRYKVNASGGLNLRKEPTTQSDVILLMDNEAYVTLVADDVQESDGYHWYNVLYQNRTGWAASEYLEYVPPVVAETPTPGLNPDMYSFAYDNLSRNITINNLAAAITAKKITKTKITETQTQITFDKEYDNTTDYWASRKDLQGLSISPKIN